MAKFEVAAVFSDHMVLQRNKNICFFGYADCDVQVTVSLTDSTGALLDQNSAFAVNGRWEVVLGAQTAQNGCKVEVSAVAGGASGVAGAASAVASDASDFADGASGVASDASDVAGGASDVAKVASAVAGGNAVNCGNVTFNDVAIGEVWIAGGQSNMEFELQNCEEGPAELGTDVDGKAAPDPNVRFYYTNKIAWKDEHFFEAEKNTCWQTWESEGRKAWSAVGYFFAKKLARDLGCTVGLIGCNWGGTSASCWMDKSYLEKDDELRTYLEEQEEATKGKTIEQQLKEYADYEADFAKWNEQFSKLWEEHHGITWAEGEKILGKNPWPGPCSCNNPFRPTGLYECMLQRITPYTAKGVLWYQGESDDHKPQMYAKLFSTMIDNWRTDWKDDTLPFVFVQLPEHRYEADKDFKHWCFVREAQEKVHNTVKNAFMTCALDQGKFNDIHPTAKKVVAERMENIALAKVYGLSKSEDAFSPMLESFICRPATATTKGSITLTFKNAAAGFELHDDQKELDEYKKMEANQGNTVPEDFTGFEIAGSNGVYYPAEFAFGGTDGRLNTISLHSEKVPNPVFARYAWYNYGPVTVFGKNGLPLAPFRTSKNDQQSATEHAGIQQIMTVAND